MWNSPHCNSERGKRYELADISALVLPLDELLGLSKSMRISEIVGESILKPLERDEIIFALYQVLDAFLGDVEVPAKGHTGIQEALVAELLNQAHAKVCCELDVPESGHGARKAVWRSVERLLIQPDSEAACRPWVIEEIELNLSAPQPFLSKKLTNDVWEELTLGASGLCDEFLWDTDWRLDSLMDLPPDAARSITQMTGIDLDVVQALAHTPTAPELRMAEHFISYVIWKDEMSNART